MKNLGERIRELRIEKNLTQPELAKKLKVSNAVVSFWENNLNEPKASYIYRMCITFGVSADYLLGLKEY